MIAIDLGLRYNFSTKSQHNAGFTTKKVINMNPLDTCEKTGIWFNLESSVSKVFIEKATVGALLQDATLLPGHGRFVMLWWSDIDGTHQICQPLDALNLPDAYDEVVKHWKQQEANEKAGKPRFTY